ncbi:MAG TPA: sigma-70 family RNA polymerase sigma factor [Chitinophagaceae bacterium]|nr:sigma-70 family RNA polymerase sigma factor [Chitinophagaceae bacterium]
MISEEQNIDSIISGCKAGNRKAQEQLYRSYYRAMMNLCLRYTKTETDALEVLNTGFYKVFKNIHRYNSARATLYTWIRTVIINSCLDFIKTTQHRSEAGELDRAANIHVAPSVIAKMSASEILKLVRQLSPATQAVFNLYVMEGYNHVEIAKMTGISEGTSKWHLSEARKRLQKMINEQNIQ